MTKAQKRILVKKMVLLATAVEPKLNIIIEGLKSSNIEYEVRDSEGIKERNVYVREEDLEEAQSIIQQGQWGEVI